MQTLNFSQRWAFALATTGLSAILLGSAILPSLALPTLIAQSAERSSETITGELTSNSSVLEDDGSYYEIHTFEGVAGEVVTIELTSDDFDTYLLLQDPAGDLINQDDDGAGGTNSRITLTLPSTGTYTLIVNSYAAGETGAYSLEWRPADATDTSQITAQSTFSRTPQILEHDSSTTTTLQVNAGEILTFEMTSEEFEPNLTLQGAGITAFQDNFEANESTTSRIIAIFPEAGFYFLRAEGGTEDETGNYRLEWRSATSSEQKIVLASQLNAQAFELYDDEDRYSEAEELFRQALAIREEYLRSDHPAIAQSLNNLALLYNYMERYEEAESLHKRALSIYEENDHPDIIYSLRNLALLYIDTGRIEEAEPLYKRELLIREEQLGANPNDIAEDLVDIGMLLEQRGYFSKAEPLLLEALLIREELLDANDILIAESMNALAYLYDSMGRYDEAEAFYKKALEIYEAQLESNHPSILEVKNNIAFLYLNLFQYEDAEEIFEEILPGLETQFGRRSAAISGTLNNLALVYLYTGRYEEAIPLFQEVLAIREEQLGGSHRFTAQSLNNLAEVYRLTDQYEKAETLYNRSLAINEHRLGQEHSEVAINLSNLSLLYREQEQPQSALTYLRRALAIEETILSRNLVGGSEASKQDYLATTRFSTYGAISLHINELPTNIAAAQLALTTILQRKGRILDQFTNLRTQLADDPDALNLLDNLSLVSTQLSNLANNPSRDLSQEIYQAEIDTLQSQIHDLQDQLSRYSSEFAELVVSPTLGDIQAALPADTALVEFIRYSPFNPDAVAEERYGDARYAAYILQSDGTIEGLDLGSAEAIDQAVAALSISLASPNTPIGQVKEEAKFLETLVVAPVRNALGTTRTVFLSPDSALNLIPFEALVDESGRYLVETYQFRYLTSGRDLMRLENTIASTNSAVLVGNPTYGRPGELVAQADPRRTIDFKNRIFPALPGTQAEVDLIAPQLPGSEVYTATNATEDLIKQQVQPSILHIATHGFFEPSGETLNPLLQSGLILAGAAAEGQSGPDQDGILTALEVTGLNLRGTQLVVLSACETGLGELTAGEGVYGLRRALVLAGSQSQVISLWKVDDTATQEWMVKYYNRLLTGAPRDQALRDTQRAFLLEHPDYSHPYYWAAFIGSGDWRPLTLDY